VLEQTVEGLKKLRPPSGNANGREVTAWRWTIAITVGATAVSLGLHIALACGFLTAVHPGFASAADVSAMRDERRAERETDLETKILDVRLKQCTSDATVRSLHTQTLQKMLVEYDKLTGRQYPLPGCEDFR
jgi:hypothetical protein